MPTELTDLSTILRYLSSTPLFGFTITLITYSLSHRLYVRANHTPLLNPVMTSSITLIIFLMLTGISYEAYFVGAQFMHFLLGPATVALAIPLYKQLSKLKQVWLPVGFAISGGATIAALSSVYLARLFGGSAQTQLSLAPKSVTTPVAMAISKQIGGLPSLTAALVIVTGILGAVFGTRILDLVGIKDNSTQGIAMGVTAHGIGTARAFQVNTQLGAFSGLAMALSALATAAIVPWLVGVLGL
ncbi:MAG: hypothetical protein CSB47_10510 [Proteobacteria bacterium]|nr:MAG: hypothetical protein CSB47_10510 [Pseudomonadota bacterium]